jgi:glycerol-3-phosphate dehydrogenase subunit C
MNDEECFPSIDPVARMALAGIVRDMGEYLLSLRPGKTLVPAGRHPDVSLVYFPPCHQRELGIGLPYHDLLTALPGTAVTMVHGALDCCGMGGHLGFKKSFHPLSVAIGKPLFRKILDKKPQALVTDCLSCRIQFRQNLPIPVFHPLELLAQGFSEI